MLADARPYDQRWAPSAYNLRPLGVSLGISGHRTDLVQEISEPDRDRAQAERELTYAGSRMGTGDWQTVRVGLGVSNTRPIPSGYRAGIGNEIRTLIVIKYPILITYQSRRITDMKEPIRGYRANGINPGRKLSVGDKGFC